MSADSRLREQICACGASLFSRGLTHGSTAEGEWEEALWKARFVKTAVNRD